MKILTALLAGLFSVPAFAYVGQWHSYTDKTHVTSLIEHNGSVYAGTTGGIRRVTLGDSLIQADFDNLDGLLDVWITSFARGMDGTLWAVARDGYLYNLKGNRWNVTGRSYASLGWKMNDRAIVVTDSNFFLGSEKGLTIFDTKKKVAQLNVVRFQNETEVSVLSLLKKADTLYAGTTRGIYKAPIDFDKPLNPLNGSGYPNLADPNAWTKVSSVIGYSLTLQADSVVAGSNGTLVESPIRIEAFSGKPLVIGTQTYAGNWNDFTTGIKAGNRVFVGGVTGLFVSENPTGSVADARLIAPLTEHPRDTIYNIGANKGNIWGQSRAGVHQLSNAGGFTAVNSGIINSVEVTYRELRNVKVADNGDVYVGVW